MPNVVHNKQIQNYNEVSAECVSYKDFIIDSKYFFLNLIGCYFFIWEVHGDFINVHDIFQYFSVCIDKHAIFIYNS